MKSVTGQKYCNYCNCKIQLTDINKYYYSISKFCNRECYKNNKTARTHGMSTTFFYKKWVALNIRICGYDNKHKKYYKNINNLWKSFEHFKNDMYKSYLKHVEKHGEKETTLDRIDSKGNYCKENCRWATKKEQANNRSNNTIVLYDGIKDTISNHARKNGLLPNQAYNRFKYGWSIDDVFKKPIKHTSRLVKTNV